MVSAGVIPLRRLGSGLLTISKLAFRTRDSLRAKAEASMIGPSHLPKPIVSLGLRPRRRCYARRQYWICDLRLLARQRFEIGRDFRDLVIRQFLPKLT